MLQGYQSQNESTSSHSPLFSSAQVPIHHMSYTHTNRSSIPPQRVRRVERLSTQGFILAKPVVALRHNPEFVAVKMHRVVPDRISCDTII
jgi:hypothetical protein